MFRNRVKRQTRGTMSALFIVLALNTPLQAADSYLEALDAEAKSVDSPATTTTTTPSNPDWSPDQHSISGHLKSGLSQVQFEEELKAGYFGSYLFYSKLRSQDKEAVYQEYLKDNDIEKLRELIKNKLTQ